MISIDFRRHALLLVPLLVGLAVAVATSSGTLRVRLARLPTFVVPSAGVAQVTDDGSLHLLSFTLPGGTFGPSTVTHYVLETAVTGISSLRFTLSQNLSGSFSGISGGPPGGGPMGLSGIAKICVWIEPICSSGIFFPLTPTTGGAGFGIGGTASHPGAVALTMYHAPWTIGQPTMTIHTPNSTITTPTLPGGFATPPSATAQSSGVLQLVTVTKIRGVPGFAEGPAFAILNLHFVPEPGTLLLLGSGVVGLAFIGRRHHRR